MKYLCVNEMILVNYFKCIQQQVKSTGQENRWNIMGYEVAIKFGDEYIKGNIFFPQKSV